MSTKDTFDNSNLDKGIAVFDNTFKVNTMKLLLNRHKQLEVYKKYYNAQAKLIEKVSLKQSN